MAAADIVKVVFVLGLLAVFCNAGPANQDKYGVVIDAGSSGSRIWVYKWDNSGSAKTLRKPQAVGKSFKVEGGIAAYATNITALENILKRLTTEAAKEVPASIQATTPIYFFATAGMRLLEQQIMNDAIDHIRVILRNKNFNPFKLYNQHFHAKVLSGEEEGVFAWICVSYLLGKFEPIINPAQQTSETVGIMEMGGASTQIAFIPDSGNILESKFPLRIASQRYPLYIKSYLNYGIDKVNSWIRQQLKSRNTAATKIDNPCMMRGEKETEDGVEWTGTGKPAECVELLKLHVNKIPGDGCNAKPCAIGPVYMPSIPTNKTFYAVGAFIGALQTLGVAAPDGSFRLESVNTTANAYCQREITEVEAEFTAKNRTLSREKLSKGCVVGLYMNVLMNHGYELDVNRDKLRSLGTINGTDIDWTLGAVLYEIYHNDDQCESLALKSCASIITVILPSLSPFAVRCD